MHPTLLAVYASEAVYLLMRKVIVTLFLFCTGILPVFSQISAPSSSVTQQTTPPAQMAPTNYVALNLDQLMQTSQETVNDLSRVRVEKWKTDERYKDQARTNSQSLQRNLTAALPALVQQVRATPGSVAANLKLYRNLNAVYDVLTSFAESVGAFGSKDDYNALARDSSNFEKMRRGLADQLEQMAANQDAQVAKLTAQIQAQQQAAAAAAAAAPKRVVVDDNATPAKKPATTPKRKTAAKPAATPAQTTPQ